MKDEEIAEKHAEEYVMRKDIITENDRVPFDNGYGFQTVSFEDEVKKGYKDGFLAGLKASRPQWHDLEKDPTDLPKDKHNVWCKCLDQCGEGWYDKDTNIWTLVYRDYHVSCIEAWCELPNFDKE